MTLYSTILNSNNAGGKSIVENWLKDHKFFMGVDEQDVVVDINDDLSLTIKSLGYDNSNKNSLEFYSYSLEFYPYLDICITKLPPFGIKRVNGFNKVEFINITDGDSKLPKSFYCCNEVCFSYCNTNEEYIKEIKENLKKNKTTLGCRTKISLNHTTLV